MKQMTRLVIPMERTMRIALTKRAKELGFDSAQALLRYMAQAVIDERPIYFGYERGMPVIYRCNHQLNDDQKSVDNV